jgi:NAD(P)-dependent dehydrogenase (short-subunit alcohol dehydrogenase family)
MVAYRSVLITGASSGLGRALALALAAPGVELHLSGRDPARLEAVAAACRARGAGVEARLLDVCDAAAMEAWILGTGRLDLVVANAGISAGTGDGRPENPAQTRAIFATNLDGMLNTVLPALAVMRAQPPGPDGVRGRIGAVASIAAFVAAPGAPAYCAGKAAVDAWTVAAAVTAARQGVLMSSICPGYVRTAMTARNRFPMPGLMDADRAAGIMLRGLAAGRRRIVFPWWMGAAARLVGLLPPRLSGALLSIPPGKDAMPEGT